MKKPIVVKWAFFDVNNLFAVVHAFRLSYLLTFQRFLRKIRKPKRVILGSR